ncbi:hypothetical protein ACFOU2_14355 [Bacillus songklensis]|uniref:Uncharacterized protein n=1 Tax=Bacillus songklensis TaxID=1069116 RepID=A0ABV8B5N2_9BACI
MLKSICILVREILEKYFFLGANACDERWAARGHELKVSEVRIETWVIGGGGWGKPDGHRKFNRNGEQFNMGEHFQVYSS